MFIENLADPSGFARSANADFLFQNLNFIGKKLVHNAHKNKFKVFAWNIDDIGNFQKMLELKVDGVGSNKPNVLIKYLKG